MSYTIAGMLRAYVGVARRQAGKKILNEHLVLGTFGAYGALGYYLASGPSKPKQSGPSDGPAFGAKSA